MSSGVVAERVEPGPVALDRLAELIEELGGSDPFTPVTVVVDSHPAALRLRRELAARSPRGTAGVIWTTPASIIAERGGPALSDRVPLSRAALGSALARLLAERPGAFAVAAEHPATHRAVTRALEQLAEVPVERLADARRELGPVAADLVRLAQEVTEEVPGRYYWARELTEAALVAIASGPRPDPTVVFLPAAGGGVRARLVAAIGARAPVRLLVAETGDGPADAWLGEQFAGARSGAGVLPLVADELITATDLDDEVRHAVRVVSAALSRGASPERCAICVPRTLPYARLVHQHLAAAGIPFHGPSPDTLSATRSGRYLTGVLALPAAAYGREAVLGVLALDARDHPLHRFRRLSAERGILRGRSTWRKLLTVDDEPELAAALSDAVEELAAVVEGPLGSWAEASARLVALLERAGDGSPAGSAVAELVASVAELDELEAPPTLPRLAHVLEDLIDRPAPAVGQIGHGVAVGTAAALAGGCFDVMVAVGQVEAMATGGHEDVLLTDRLRQLSDGVLPGRDPVRIRAELATVARSAQHLVLTRPRTDHRDGRTMVPVRWLADWTRSGVEAARPCRGTDVASHPQGVLGVTVEKAASRDELVLSALTAAAATGRDPLDHPLAPVRAELVPVLEAAAARRSGQPSRFTGLVPAGLVPDPVSGGVISPTALEELAACPRRYLFGRVMGVAEIEEPDELVEIDPRDRGTLIHRVLEYWIGEQIEAGRADDLPTEADRQRLLEIFDHEAARLEARGRTGVSLVWADQCRRWRALLGQVFDQEVEQRRAGRRPRRTEWRVGFDGEPARLGLPDGTEAAVRGLVDRVDETPEGWAVVDYKTSRPDSPSAEPLRRGRRLQLPLYALAVGQQMGGGPVTASYRHLNLKSGVKEVAVAVDEELRAELGRTVQALVAPVRAGLFPPHPGEATTWPRVSWDNCSRCSLDPICSSSRAGEWDSAREQDGLAPYRALVEGEAEPSPEPEDSSGDGPSPAGGSS